MHQNNVITDFTYLDGTFVAACSCAFAVHNDKWVDNEVDRDTKPSKFET